MNVFLVHLIALIINSQLGNSQRPRSFLERPNNRRQLKEWKGQGCQQECLQERQWCEGKCWGWGWGKEQCQEQCQEQWQWCENKCNPPSYPEKPCQQECQQEWQSCEGQCWRWGWKEQQCQQQCEQQGRWCENKCNTRPPPTTGAPWCTGDGKSVSHSGSSYMMECLNGRRCNVKSEGWGCCASWSNGSSQRGKCPPEKPWMCARPDSECAHQYCCSDTEWDCGKFGGLRSCPIVRPPTPFVAVVGTPHAIVGTSHDLPPTPSP